MNLNPFPRSVNLRALDLMNEYGLEYGSVSFHGKTSQSHSLANGAALCSGQLRFWFLISRLFESYYYAQVITFF